MSKSAAYQALGEGLMFGAAQWQQNRVQTAAQRREEALMAIRRKWQQEDKEENRDFQLGLMDRADQRWEDRYDRQRQDAVADREYTSPSDQARIDLTRAQAEYYQDRANKESDDDPFSIAKINLSSFTPTSVAAAKRYVEESGDEAGAMELLEYKSNVDRETQIEQNIRAQALQATNDILSSEYISPEQIYEQYGIPLNASPTEAREKIFREQYRFLSQTMIDDPMAAAQQDDERIERPLMDAPLAARPDADEQQAGIGENLGGAARSFVSPVWSERNPLHGAAKGIVGAASDFAGNFAQGFTGDGGLDDRLIQDVANDLQTMGEDAVRAELRRSGEPNPDRVIEAAKARMRE